MTKLARSLRACIAPLGVLSLAVACGTGSDDASPPREVVDASSPTPDAAPAPKPAQPDPKPPPKPRIQGLAFVHGTGDRGNVSGFACDGADADWHCGSASGIDYWGQSTIDSERTRTDGTLRPFVAVGCPLSAYTPWPNPSPVKPKNSPPEPGSADCVSTEIARFLSGPDGVIGTDDDVDDLVIVTHSGGGNVARYILQQHSARPEFTRIHAAARGVVAIANPARGTYLADRVFGNGVLGIGNDVLGIGYDDDGTDFIQTSKMAVYNQDPAKFVDLSKDIAGVPAFVASGSYPDKDGDKDKVNCAGSSEALGLNVAHTLYLNEDDDETARDKCSDGFISCTSAMALANGDLTRVIFGKLGDKTVGQTRFRNHNQTRRDCDRVDLDVRATVNSIFGGPSTSLVAAWAPERFVARTRTTRQLFRGGAVELPALAVRSSVALRVDELASLGALEAFATDPTGVSKLPLALDRDASGVLVALASLPPAARAGAWTIHLGTRSELDTHVEARLPFWVSSARGTIVDAHAHPDDAGIVLQVQAQTTGGARIGLRGTLVSETSGEAWTIASAQASVDADPKGGSLRFGLFFRLPPEADSGSFSVRDLALVSHDDASTLDLRDRVDLER